MRVLMFGPLEVHCEGSRFGAANLGGVKPKQILEMLLLRRGHLVSIDALADGLWPSRPPKDVPATLNTYVSVLRHLIFRDQTEARRVIFTSPRAYGFSVDGPDVDLDTFDDLVVRAERAPRDERLRLLTAAVEQARGPLLEDALDDEWTREERSAYTGRLTRAHICLAKDFLLEVAPLTALRHGHSARSLSPYSEEAARMIMISNYALGFEDQSRAAYEHCRTTIGDDLGLDVTSTTANLAAAIDAGAPVAEMICDLMASSYDVPQGRSRKAAGAILLQRPRVSVRLSGRAVTRTDRQVSGGFDGAAVRVERPPRRNCDNVGVTAGRVADEVVDLLAVVGDLVGCDATGRATAILASD